MLGFLQSHGVTCHRGTREMCLALAVSGSSLNKNLTDEAGKGTILHSVEEEKQFLPNPAPGSEFNKVHMILRLGLVWLDTSRQSVCPISSYNQDFSSSEEGERKTKRAA